MTTPLTGQKGTDAYGSWFVSIVGSDKLHSLPEVQPSKLHLQGPCIYPEYLRPSFLPLQFPAVRGMLSYDRPFIAINIELLDKTKKVIDVVTELIYKPYSIYHTGKDGEIHRDRFITANLNISYAEKTRRSFFYCPNGLSEEQVKMIRDLLAGEDINPPFNHIEHLVYLRKAAPEYPEQQDYSEP